MRSGNKSKPVTQIAIEESQLLDISIPQINFFLSRLKKGNVNYIKYKRPLIDLFINRAYLYDGMIVIIFNTGERPVELNTELLATINKGVFNSNTVKNFRTCSTLNCAAPSKEATSNSGLSSAPNSGRLNVGLFCVGAE